MSSVVSQLHFVRAGGPGTAGRHPIPHKPTRRRLESGIEMQGNLHTLGYFSATMCVGNPAQHFDVIIDTGSALTAVPCVDCSHCGAHTHDGYTRARYDGSASTSFSALSCRDASNHCHSCTSGDQCSYSVSYTEGSSIRGRVVAEIAWFASESGSHLHSVPCTFGCQTYESGLFYSQVADGISGLSQSQSYGPTLFDSLRSATGAPDVFSICLDEEVGALVLGGSIPSKTRASAEWIPYTGYGSYSVTLSDLSIGSSRHPATA